MGSDQSRLHLALVRDRKHRLLVHGIVAGVAVLGVGFASGFAQDGQDFPADLVPPVSLPGIVGVHRPIAEAYVRPGASLLTRDSTVLLLAKPDIRSIRLTGEVTTASTISSTVALGAAASGESGGGLRPLADIIDPRQPYALYETQPGDSLSGIADRYGIKLRTLLDNNPTVTDKELIPRGLQLIVPRKDGILYKVGHGETVDSIVAQYDNTTSGIVIDYRPNNIADPKRLPQGEFILLPGATIKPPPPPPPPPPARTGGGGQGGAPLPGGAGRFRMPLAAYNGVTDAFGVARGGGSYHQGIDLGLWSYHHSNVFSACDGVVIRTEYLTYSYGYYVVVDCGDGWSTLYAHLSQITVSPGQRVAAGTIVGVSGVTGYTTGEHLHFEIRKDGAAVDPAAYLPF
jgi:murein DD-endopeptidase MepM/ murein hydrolase activator NlpD